jgi:hypothetical protein
LLNSETAVVIAEPFAPVKADQQKAPSASAAGGVLEESATVSPFADRNKAPAFDGRGREGERPVQLAAPRQKADAGADHGFAMEIARVRAEALREGRNLAAAEYERQVANERRRWLAAFEEQLANVRRDANDSEAAAVRDVQQAAAAATEHRLGLERAQWEEAIRAARAEAEADAECRFGEHEKRLGEEFEARLAAVRTEADRERAAAVREVHEEVMGRLTAEVARARDAAILEAECQRRQELTQVSAKVEHFIADQLRAAQAEDEWRRDRVAEATRALSALQVDLAEVAAARRHQAERALAEL